MSKVILPETKLQLPGHLTCDVGYTEYRQLEKKALKTAKKDQIIPWPCSKRVEKIMYKAALSPVKGDPWDPKHELVNKYSLSGEILPALQSREDDNALKLLYPKEVPKNNSKPIHAH